MIRRTVEFSLRHRFVVLSLALLVALLGLLSATRLPSDVLPDLTAPVILVFVENPGRSAQEMETTVSRPLEGVVRGLYGVERVQSLSGPGLSSLIVTFGWNHDFFQALRQVSTAVSQLQASFPPGTLPPVLSSAASRMNQVMELYLTGPVSTRKLREIGDYTLAPALTSVAGVQKVIVMGGEKKQYQVRLDPSAVAEHGLTVDGVARAVHDAAQIFSGGLLEHGATELPIRGDARIHSLEELRELRISTPSGASVPLSELGDVTVGSALRRGISTVGGHEVVTAAIVKQFGVNTREVVGRVREQLAQLRPQLPEGVRLHVYYNQSDLIRISNRSLEEALLIGSGAVMLVIFLLLGDWVATLLITAVIPLAVLPAFLFMQLAGITINTMSLGGIIVALGIMIDAAIVDTENIFRHLQGSPEDAFRATVEGSLEVRRPVVFATLIIVAVFLPIFFLPGLADRIFTPFAFTAIATIAFGFLLSLTATPALAYTFLPGRASRVGRESPVLRLLGRIFRPALDFAFRHPWPVLGATAALAAVTLLVATGLPVGFLPEFDEGAIMLKAQTPPGTGLAETDRIARRVAAVAATAPDVAEVVSRAGRPEGTEDIEGVNNSEIFVGLVPFGRRTRSTEDIRAWLRRKLDPLPGTRMVVTSPLVERIEESLGGATAPFNLKIFGNDPAELADISKRAARAMASIPGFVDIVPEQVVGTPQLQVEPDREALARYDVSEAEVARTVETAFRGTKVGTILEQGRKSFPIQVRLEPADRDEVGDLRQLTVPSRQGRAVPLRLLARVHVAEGPALIRREAGQRRTQIRAGLSGVGLERAVSELRSKLDSLHLPADVRLEFGGSYQAQQELKRSMLLAAGLSVLLIFLLLQAGFDSVLQAVIVLATIPLGLIGGVLALWITGLSLNVASMVGLLAHFGLAVQKSVLLVEHANHERSEGRTSLAAAWRSAVVRFRPVLMTASAASLAVLPVALGYGAGSELQQPMAVVLIGGLVTSTLLTLLVLPLLLRPSLARR